MRKLLIALLFSVGLQAQSFDFDCSLTPDDPEYYLELFLSDAKSSVSSETYEAIKAKSGTFIFDNRDGVQGYITPGKPVASATYCTNNWTIWIDIDWWAHMTYWDNLRIEYGQRSSRRLHIMYHELGHSLLDLDHKCEYVTVEGSSSLYRQGIMGTGACPDDPPESVILPWDVIDDEWDIMVSELMDRDNQNKASCTTFKGVKIIHD